MQKKKKKKKKKNLKKKSLRRSLIFHLSHHIQDFVSTMFAFRINAN